MQWQRWFVLGKGLEVLCCRLMTEAAGWLEAWTGVCWVEWTATSRGKVEAPGELESTRKSTPLYPQFSSSSFVPGPNLNTWRIDACSVRSTSTTKRRCQNQESTNAGNAVISQNSHHDSRSPPGNTMAVLRSLYCIGSPSCTAFLSLAT